VKASFQFDKTIRLKNFDMAPPLFSTKSNFGLPVQPLHYGCGSGTDSTHRAARWRERATLFCLLIVNVRIVIDLAVLETFVREAALKAGEAREAQVNFHRTQSFRPGRPVPTHRYANGA
jgi:hypothetical protein